MGVERRSVRRDAMGRDFGFMAVLLARGIFLLVE
jgi:hypothetical protein